VSQDLIGTHLRSSLAALERTTRDVTLLATVRRIAVAIITALNAGNKILVIGNGGSAADAQHIAAEIVGRYKQDRPAYAAIALTTDTSALTAISNDYGFEWVFARQVEGLGRRGDVLLALTTSGRSQSILKALSTARSLGIVTIGFTGTQGETMGALCDDLLIAPSDDTPIIQQIHLTIAHAICEVIEQAMMQLAASRASPPATPATLASPARP
jgi:D-sedoheptulose 7-phosphate isomerase